MINIYLEAKFDNYNNNFNDNNNFDENTNFFLFIC